MFISDVIARIEAGGLAYSDANRRKVLGALRRCPAVYATPAVHIPVDLDLFDRRWGRGKVKTYPLEHFNSADQFATWRSNVRGAIGQFTGATAAAAARRASNDGWSDLLAAFDALSDAGLLFARGQRIGLERLADCARRKGIEPQNVTMSDVVSFRETFCVTANQKTSLGRAARTFDMFHTVPGLDHLLPPVPLGPLPSKRPGRGELFAVMPPSFGVEWARWRNAYQLGTPSPLSGSSDPKSAGYMGQFDAAIRLWIGVEC